MVKTSGIYNGQKNCELLHDQSGYKIETDAPLDNQGKGEKFSPTDLVGAALGACMMTIMGIVSERDGVSIQGSSFSVEKEMVSNPRRISILTVSIHLPKSIPIDYRKKLENSAMTCPVKKSLHPDIEIPIRFDYDL